MPIYPLRLSLSLFLDHVRISARNKTQRTKVYLHRGAKSFVRHHRHYHTISTLASPLDVVAIDIGNKPDFMSAMRLQCTAMQCI